MKINKILTVFVLIITMFNCSFGANLIDSISSEEIIKFSDIDNLDLPFNYFSSDRIEVDELVEKSGILFAAGNLITKQDLKGMHLIISGETITIDENIENAIIIARNVIINGDINRDSIIFSTNVVVSDTCNVNGDLLIYSGNVELNGVFNENVIVNSETLKFGGNVKKDLRAEAYNFIPSENAKIDGELVINTTNKELVNTFNFSNVTIDYQEEVFIERDITSIVIDYIIKALIFSLLYLLFRKKCKVIDNTFNKIKNNTSKFVIFGFLVLPIVTVLFIVLVLLSLAKLSVITIPLMIAMISIVVITLTLSTFISGSVIFRYIEEKKGEVFNTNSSILVGSFVVFFVLQLLNLVPVINSYISIIIGVMALGAVYSMIFFKNNKKEVIEKIND